MSWVWGGGGGGGVVKLTNQNIVKKRTDLRVGRTAGANDRHPKRRG